MEFTGRITTDARISVVKGGKEVVNFSIALNERYKPKGSSESKEFTTYIDVAWWMNPAVGKILKKGAIVTISGRIYPRAYSDMEGNPKASINCHANKIQIIHFGKTTTKESTLESPEITDPVDDLPF
ncbi:MAG: single-stranded DNA-binding protein [Chitinophagaceae bacterium]|nr:single-stranded DNA-binding protein [Chitinophagaceae bacterium]